MGSSEYVVAMSGASGAPYGVALLESLLAAEKTIHLVISQAATEVFEQELGRKLSIAKFSALQLLGRELTESEQGRLRYHHCTDFRAGIASGSFLTAGMVICPCSMGTVAAIANGLSQNLIHRAADVHLKERRKLILVPRETPLHLVQLRNLTACAEAGATVLPAMPAFYTNPKSVQDMVDFVVARILDHLGVPHNLLRRWGTA